MRTLVKKTMVNNEKISSMPENEIEGSDQFNSVVKKNYEIYFNPL